ncbi:hypothetical protein KUS09_003970 [Escherichia coli]|uniref:hypothetical protein n=3 Tax=Escherichia coli TaxID=562 RepID=UPI0010819671|nr:hypothetical protein [Escherichia coli]EES4557455.1 hypothetical protein [Escherichia coli]EFE6866242.1 hypothetical protein [Escherichia coli]EHR8766626.1 hypothetical protein [Escherichia coli]EIC1759277.1 hypothetical protein [Escherichia coli]EJE8169380.1 hypothetical protein [Escherichia coli]
MTIYNNNIGTQNTKTLEQFQNDLVKADKKFANSSKLNAVIYKKIDGFTNLLKDLIHFITHGKVEFNSQRVSKLMAEVTSFESNLDGTPKDINFISQNDYLRQTVSIRQDGLGTKIIFSVEETHFNIDHGGFLHGKKWSETRSLPEELNMAIVVENLRKLTTQLNKTERHEVERDYKEYKLVQSAKLNILYNPK